MGIEQPRALHQPRPASARMTWASDRVRAPCCATVVALRAWLRRQGCLAAGVSGSCCCTGFPAAVDPRRSVWRRLKRLGVAQLADGVVALPADARTREQPERVA